MRNALRQIGPAIPVRAIFGAPTWSLSCTFGCGAYQELESGAPKPRNTRCYMCNGLMLVEHARSSTGSAGGYQSTGHRVGHAPTLSQRDGDWD